MSRYFARTLKRVAIVGVGAIGAVCSAHCYSNLNSYVYPSRPWDDNWDRREPLFLVKRSRRENRYEPPKCSAEELQKYTPTATRHVILIRHGESNYAEMPAQHMYLTEKGREQAKLTGTRLKSLGIPVNTLISSTSNRAHSTACLLAEDLPGELQVTRDPLLQEGVPALPDPSLPRSEWDVPMSEIFQDGPRIEAAFRKYVHRASPSQREDTYDVIVCHGNVIRYFICRALQFPGEGWLRLTVNHGSLTTLSIGPDGDVVVQSINDTGHLPPDKITIL